MTAMTIYHIPVCPFSQRVEILLKLKRRTNAVDFHAVDITRPRPDWLLAKTGGSTKLPVLETQPGEIVRESLVIMHYLEERFADPAIIQQAPEARALEDALVALEEGFTSAGYRMLLNIDPRERPALVGALLEQYARLDALLGLANPHGIWLHDRFGFAEAVFTPMFIRFWTLEYYEEFALPDEPRYRRVRRWRDACLAHPAAQQVSREEVIKLYYDYALGSGNGALVPGRQVSSFVFEPHWTQRPWPPAQKYSGSASDAALGLL
jgi:glutathione S-transferase